MLQTINLSKHFGGLKVVNEVNFYLAEGEVHALIGPNGAGKTTFVNLLCGQGLCDSGCIKFNQKDITRLPAHQRVKLGISYTFQITSIYPTLSVYDNMAIAMQSNETQQVDAQVVELLRRVDLAQYIHETAGNLAYGHQRVLEIAMGLALKPKLLILDEPTQGLSDSEIRHFCNLIKQVNKTTTILLIEHNMQVVMALAEKITVMNQGKILAHGSPDEIRNNSEVQVAYLGS